VSVVNISCYKFVSLTGRDAMKADLTGHCEQWGMKGTILLAPEGINLFLAGSRSAIDEFMTYLRADPRFADMAPKESHSAVSPFKRLRVRLKKEIITMKHPVIRPEAGRAPAVSAATLKTWLDQGCDDEGRPVVLLDTRNDYEVAAGSFVDAVDYTLDVFSEFPGRFERNRDKYNGKTVVSFCTGGIRCEKAALFMKEIGVEHVYQLEGGILKYFEDEGGAHFRGSCFVFDAREAVNSALQPLRVECLEAPEDRVVSVADE